MKPPAARANRSRRNEGPSRRGAGEGGADACGQQEFHPFSLRDELTASDRDVAKEDLWLVWYQLEPSWNSWRALRGLPGQSRINRTATARLRFSPPPPATPPRRSGAWRPRSIAPSSMRMASSSPRSSPIRAGLVRWKRPGIVAAVNSSAGDAVIDRVSQALSTTGAISVQRPCSGVDAGETSRSQHAILPAARMEGCSPRVNRWIDALA